MAPTRPLSIVFLVDGWQPFFNAGGETAAGEIARWLNQRGHRTTAIIPRLPREATRFEWAGTHIYRRGSTRWTDRTIRNVDADVIITQLVATDLGTDYATRLGLPLAHLVHNDHTLENHNVTAGDLIISNAKWVDERTPERAAHIDRIVVHPPTIGLDQIPTSDPRRRWLTIVNASEIKGGAIFGELARRRPRLPFLTVTGGYGKHPQPQTPNHQQILNRPTMSHVWARTRILLVPSEYESWGKAAGEAMAHGIPVIAHPTPGLVENLADAGYYANRANLDAWLERIDGLYYNPDEYSEASAAVRARARELEAITIGQLETLEARLLELASRRRATEIPA